MFRRPGSQKRVMAAVVVFAAMAARTSWAQLPGGPVPVITIPGSVTSDQSVETSTLDIDTRQLPPVVASLTTTTIAPKYVPSPPPLDNITNEIGAGVNAQNATDLMPVSQGLPCNSYDHMLKVAAALQQTYLTAMETTQGLAGQLQSEDLTQVATNIQAPAELAATQGVGQAVLALVNEVRMERAQLGELTMVMAAGGLQQLDANVRARMPREGDGCD